MVPEEHVMELPEKYTEAGWVLEWDGFGWVTAVHPSLGRTKSSYPTKSRGLKFVVLSIEKIHEQSKTNLEEA